jgi:hypothetical protein
MYSGSLLGGLAHLGVRRPTGDDAKAEQSGRVKDKYGVLLERVVE